PAVGVLALERAQDAVGDGRAADAVEAIAAGDHVALELLGGAVAQEGDPRALALEVVDGDVGDLEVQRQAGGQARGRQVLYDLGLTVDDDAAPAGQLAHRDVMALAVVLQVDPAVDDPLAVHPLADAGVAQQVDGSLLEDPGADALLDVLARAVL